MNGIPAEFPSVFTDRLVAALGCRVSLMIQLELRFSRRLDEERLACALDRLLDAEPVLGCRFVETDEDARWERLAPADRSCFEHARTQAEYDAFIVRPAAPHRGPPVCACLWPADDGDRLALKVAHEVADASGTKDIAARLSAIYERLRSDPDFRPAPNVDGARDHAQVLRRVPSRDRPGLWLRWAREIRRYLVPRGSLQPPMPDGPAGRIAFVCRELDAALVGPLAAWGRARGATLNDIVLAAFFRALVALADWNGRTPLRCTVTVDVRRHLPAGHAGGIANLSALEFFRLPLPLGDDFDETVERVAGETRLLKSKWAGLNAYVALLPAVRRLSHARLKRTIKSLIDGWVQDGHFPPGLTNMGPLDPGRLYFDGFPDHARLLVPPIHPPGLSVGLSGYRGALTLSAGAYPETGGDRVAAKLLDGMVAELSAAQR